MTFNIRYDNPEDGINAWPHRRSWVADTISQQDPDVVGLQEALQHQTAYLAAALPDYSWYGIGRDDGLSAGEFTPIFFRAGRFEKLDQGTFWLSDTPGTPGSVGWDAAITRICTWVRLRDIESGQDLYVFNTHLDHRGERARRESSRLIIRKITEIAEPHPWVLLGDFNATPDSVTYQNITRAPAELASAVDSYTASATAPQGPGSTWNGFTAIEPGRRIDYVFAASQFHVAQIQIPADTRNGRYPSDHLPVVASLEW